MIICNICHWGKFSEKSENFPIFQLFRKFRSSWVPKRPDTSAPTPNLFEKKKQVKKMVFLMNMSGKCTPLWGPPWYQKFSQTCSMNMSGKNKTLDGTSKPWNIFPRHVHWTCLGKPPTLLTHTINTEKKKNSSIFYTGHGV